MPKLALPPKPMTKKSEAGQLIFFVDENEDDGHRYALLYMIYFAVHHSAASLLSLPGVNRVKGSACELEL